MFGLRSKIIFTLIILVIFVFSFWPRNQAAPIATRKDPATQKEAADKMIAFERELETVPDGGKIKIKLGDKSYTAEIARTTESRSKGLSGRKSLPYHQAMLFVFDEPGAYGFWMKDMNFPIDIIWIDENLKVIDVTPNNAPKSYPQIFKPKSPAQYVLEIKSQN